VQSPEALLIRFARLVSAATSPEQVLSLLADASVELVGADAAAVFRVRADGTLALAEVRNLPDGLTGLDLQADAIGSELGEDLRKASGRDFARAVTLPLVGSGGLFGALAALFERHWDDASHTVPLANALADLAGSALSQLAAYTELKRSYDELRASRQALERSEKLSALGQMASGVAHDLKNILHPLTLNLALLSEASFDEETKEIIDDMRTALKRGSDTVTLLRDFARQAPVSGAGAVDLDSVAREAVQLCRPRTLERRPPVSLELELAAPPPVRGHGSEILSGVVNLIVNAIDAVDGGGTVLLKTSAAEAGGQIEVLDDGPGMPPEVEARVFEPFFTTKGDRGTGLGLPMVYAMVSRCGGSVRLKTAPGEGSCFTLTFPAAEAPS